MIYYTRVMDFFAGWYNELDGFYIRLVLFPIILFAIIVGNIFALPAGLFGLFFETLEKKL